MTNKKQELLVLLREVCDPRPPAEVTPEGAKIRDRGLRRIVNPADLEALELALELSADSGMELTVCAVGPKRLDDALLLALAMGSPRAIRVWDSSMEGADAVGFGALLGRILEILSPVLFLTGSALLDRGADPAPVLAAARRGLPWTTSAIELRRVEGSLQTLRKSDRGARQRLVLPTPCVVTVESGFRTPRYPDMDAVLEALSKDIEVWGLPELGLPVTGAGEEASPLRPAGYAFPRPSPVRVPTPAADLPGYERTLALLSGGIQPREGRLHFGTAEEAAEGLFRILCGEGLVPGVEA